MGTVKYINVRHAHSPILFIYCTKPTHPIKQHLYKHETELMDNMFGFGLGATRMLHFWTMKGRLGNQMKVRKLYQ